MKYYVWLVNGDGSQTWLQSFSDLPSAVAFANTQTSGTYTINYGNESQMEQIQQVVVP